MLLDFDPRVAGLASQPFSLSWRSPAGRTVVHTPDYFARGVDGAAVVVDVRPADRVGVRDAAKFAVTEAICARVDGLSFRLVHEIDPVLAANVRWLAGYRHPRFLNPRLTGPLIEVFTGGAGLLAGAGAAADPIESLPAVFHLVWAGVLMADVSAPLTDATLVRADACAAAVRTR